MKKLLQLVVGILYFVSFGLLDGETLRVMVFAPHQDDDVIGCGGSIAMHVKNNHDVTIVYMTSDMGSKKCMRKYGKDGVKKVRDAEARQAADVLGVKKLIFLNCDDNFIKHTLEDTQKIVEILSQLLHDTKPHVVYIPHKHDNHPDHMLTYDLVMQAREKAKNWLVPTVLCYEIWRPIHRVSYKENISDYINLKITAIQKHQSQLEEMRFDDAIKGLNQYRAIMFHQGLYCECFEFIGIRQEFMKNIT